MTVPIDVHAHVIVAELLREAAPGESWRPRVRRDDDGRQVVELAGRKIRSAVNEFIDPNAILATMAEREIGRVVLSPWVPLLSYDADAADGAERCRLQNLGLKRVRDAHPGRVSLLGAVPLQAPELAAAELTALMAQDGFAGVEITAAVNGVSVGDPRFEPFWAAAEESDALVFIHPTTRGFPVPVLDEHYLWNLVGNPMETTIAAAHLILSGTMYRHPALRVLLAHGGGAIVALSGRIAHGQRAVPAAGAGVTEPAGETVRRFLFDTITHDPRLLRALVDAVGAERVLLGSDYPFDMADEHPVQTVAAAGLGDGARHALLAGNAERELRARCRGEELTVADARVQAAIRNWASRFIANGVDYNDFVRTTAAIEDWAQWLPAWTRTAEGHMALAEQARAAGNARSAGEAYLRAAVSYHFSKFVWMLDPERHRRNTLAAVQALYAAHALLDPSAERIETPIDGGTVVANLRRPVGGGPVPLVVLIPGLDSTKEEFFDWEAVFLHRGMATLSLDGPGQGETGLAMSIRHDYEVAVAAVLDAVAGRPGLDLHRVGAVGVSLGGHYVVRAAAFEPRIRALASVSGPFDFGADWEGLPQLTRETIAYHTGASDDDEARRRAHALDLAGVAERVPAPCLVVTGRLDRVIGWQQTKRIADAVPGAEWMLYDDGTHVCNNIPFKYRPLVSDWIRKRLG